MQLHFRRYLRTMDLNKDDWRIKIIKGKRYTVVYLDVVMGGLMECTTIHRNGTES